MSLWEFGAAVGGFAKFHGHKSDKLDDEAAADLAEFLLET
jgi:hypothetical protein